MLIDGRSAYSPRFAGVYWRVQDTLLKDVDRIEVIRGPGGTIWGADAVNSIINVIAKNAKAAHGILSPWGGRNIDQKIPESLSARTSPWSVSAIDRLIAETLKHGERQSPTGSCVLPPSPACGSSGLPLNPSILLAENPPGFQLSIKSPAVRTRGRSSAEKRNSMTGDSTCLKSDRGTLALTG